MYLSTLIKESIIRPQATLDKYLAEDEQGEVLRAQGRYAYFKLPILITIALATHQWFFNTSFLLFITFKNYAIEYDGIIFLKNLVSKLFYESLTAALGTGVAVITIIIILWLKYFFGTLFLQVRLNWLGCYLSSEKRDALWTYNTFGCTHLLRQALHARVILATVNIFSLRYRSLDTLERYHRMDVYISFLFLLLCGGYFLWLRYKMVKRVSGAKAGNVAGCFLLLSPTFWGYLSSMLIFVVGPIIIACINYYK